MTDPQFRDLTRPARGGVLLALAAGLRVVEWSQAIRDFFHLVEYSLIGLVDGVVARAVAPVVESGGCLRRGARNRDLNRWCGRTHTAGRQRERHGGEPHRGARKPDANHANLLTWPENIAPPAPFSHIGPMGVCPGVTWTSRVHNIVRPGPRHYQLGESPQPGIHNGSSVLADAHRCLRCRPACRRLVGRGPPRRGPAARLASAGDGHAIDCIAVAGRAG